MEDGWGFAGQYTCYVPDQCLSETWGLDSINMRSDNSTYNCFTNILPPPLCDVHLKEVLVWLWIYKISPLWASLPYELVLYVLKTDIWAAGREQCLCEWQPPGRFGLSGYWLYPRRLRIRTTEFYLPDVKPDFELHQLKKDKLHVLAEKRRSKDNQQRWVARAHPRKVKYSRRAHKRRY